MTDIILASKSRYRAKILADAGLNVSQHATELDERAIEAPLHDAGVVPEDRAAILAEAKAIDVSERHKDAWVIGCDQMLSLDGEILHKASSMEEARRRLLTLSGRTHMLHSAIVLARDGETVWRHVSLSSMQMRELSPEFIGRHLAEVGENVLSSVGAYQIEGPGIQLFSDIKGDMFSIIGLPLLPLLEELRRLDVIDG